VGSHGEEAEMAKREARAWTLRVLADYGDDAVAAAEVDAILLRADAILEDLEEEP
jgi:hypothetical protein